MKIYVNDVKKKKHKEAVLLVKFIYAILGFSGLCYKTCCSTLSFYSIEQNNNVETQVVLSDP